MEITTKQDSLTVNLWDLHALVLDPLHLNAPRFHRYVPPGASLQPSPERGLAQEVATHFLLWPRLTRQVGRVAVPTPHGGEQECAFSFTPSAWEAPEWRALPVCKPLNWRGPLLKGGQGLERPGLWFYMTLMTPFKAELFAISALNNRSVCLKAS